MPTQELAEIYLKLAGTGRHPDEDAAVLARLAEIARLQEIEPAADSMRSGAIGDCLNSIAQSEVLFPLAISAWLAKEEDVSLGKALQHEVSVVHLSQTFPQSYDLNGVDEEKAVIAARRLCALAATTAVSFGWALSVARHFPHSRLVSEALADVFDYHVYELPVSTHSLLTSSDSVFQELPISIATLDRLEQRNAELNALPYLQEFEMTADMRLILSTLKRGEERDIHRKADEQSIFSLIARRMHFKYGGRPSVEIRSNDGVTETTMDMFAHELSVELPLSELTDPMLGRVKRNRLWRGARR